jgi:hypothetical protein
VVVEFNGPIFHRVSRLAGKGRQQLHALDLDRPHCLEPYHSAAGLEGFEAGLDEVSLVMSGKRSTCIPLLPAILVRAVLHSLQILF